MESNKRTKVLLSLGTLLVSLITYLFTAAPTVSFWDCGEFIACANILGVPHPPGTPMFMIIGRFFILLFGFFSEIAFRVNLVSVISSAVGVMFVYLFTEKLISLVFKNKTSSFVSHAGALIAAFLVNFSDTYWFNAVEAEVYGLAMCLVMLISWLSLLWVENRTNPMGERLLLLICYIAFLGVGFHLYTVMTFPAILLLMIMIEPQTKYNYSLIITGITLLSVVYKVSYFVHFAFFTMLAWIILYFVVSDTKHKRQLNLAIWFCLLAVIGYSNHAYIPIRSSLDPRIDENNPEFKLSGLFDAKERERFSGFVERKQYGSESMLTRALHRRGDVMNQIFSHPHMGYGGYMLAQYLPWKVGEGRSSIVDGKFKGKAAFEADPDDNNPVKRLGVEFPTQMSFMPPYTNRGMQVMLFLLFHIPMLWGAIKAYKLNKPFGVYILTLYILASAGLIFYMNFSDGIRPDLGPYKQWVEQGADPANPPYPVYMEVRERDYFFTPGYIFMSVLFGLSAAFFIQMLREKKNSLGAAHRPIGVALVVVSFIVPCFSNYYEHDRSKVYVPYDYAKNLLESCLPNSVLFTNGDNDTFPLWFMQEVENVRKDVRVVNLSLVNTDWYIHQLIEQEPKLTLGFTPNQIDALQPQINQLNSPQEITLGKTGLKITLEARQSKPYYKVQDMMVMNIVQNNFPKRPIHFAVTVSNPNMMGLEKYLKMDGMVYTLTKEVHNQGLDKERTAHLVDNVYNYRGLENNDVYLNSDTRGLLSNYFATNHRLTRWAQDEISKLDAEKSQLEAQVSAAESDSAKEELNNRLGEIKQEKEDKIKFAEKYLANTERIMSWDWRHYYFASQFYRGIGDSQKAKSLLEKGLKLGKQQEALTAQLGQLYMDEADFNKAEALYKDLLDKNPGDFQLVHALLDAYEKQKKLGEAQQLVNGFLNENPTHQYAGYLKNKLMNFERRESESKAPALPPMPPVESAESEDDSGQTDSK